MKPRIICHMVTSIDGRILTDRWSESPDGDRRRWSALYGQIHDEMGGDGWIVGRVTMAEMAKGRPQPIAGGEPPPRPLHRAQRQKAPYAIALDRGGRLHFERADIDGDHVLVLLGHDVADDHLRELAAGGVSYLVAEEPEMDLRAMLEVLHSELGIELLILEGGGGINGAFLKEGLVDEISLLVVPALDGHRSSPTLAETGESGLKGQLTLSLLACRTLDAGAVHLRYAVAAA